tara:strand:- start:5670 stop:6665 length:996 start_codon:yes stop_codon:yes gene_type:complete
MTVRRTRIKLVYNDADISRDISPDLLSFDYTDKESGEADDLSVTLKNNHGLWTGDWYPGKGDTLKATIIDEGYGELYCGTFKIDDIESSGPPEKVVIKGVSVPLDESIRRKDKSKTWEDTTLSSIANEIGSTGGLQVLYDADSDPAFSRLAQNEEPDLAFLNRISSDEGFSLKVTDNKLVVFEQSKYESMSAVIKLTKGVDNIESYRFNSQAFDLYKSCTVNYYNSEEEKQLSYTYTAPNVDEGMEANVVKVADSLAEAERWAKAELRKRNKHEVTGSLTITGRTDIVAGMNIKVAGFGKYDGTYMVEEAGHSVGSGYRVALKLRRVLEGY